MLIWLKYVFMKFQKVCKKFWKKNHTYLEKVHVVKENFHAFYIHTNNKLLAY